MTTDQAAEMIRLLNVLTTFGIIQMAVLGGIWFVTLMIAIRQK